MRTANLVHRAEKCRGHRHVRNGPLYDLLTKEELETFRPDWQAPLRLLEYLDHKLDAERLPPPEFP